MVRVHTCNLGDIRRRCCWEVSIAGESWKDDCCQNFYWLFCPILNSKKLGRQIIMRPAKRSFWQTVGFPLLRKHNIHSNRKTFVRLNEWIFMTVIWSNCWMVVSRKQKQFWDLFMHPCFDGSNLLCKFYYSPAKHLWTL